MTTTCSSTCATCPSRGMSRRVLLAAAGAVGAAGLLSACATEEETPVAESGPDDNVIGDLARIREQGSLAFETADGQAIAVAAGDDVRAYSRRCTHDGCSVGWDAEAAEISCPCHGSRFSAADGSVVRGPAREPLPEVPVTVDEAEGVLRRA
jgi:cytochrome b6-f complex iron-sulfur subunit